MRELAKQAVFGEDKSAAQDEIKRIAEDKGIFLSSTRKLYKKMAKGECAGFTVPAFNLRTLTFDMARAVFRAAKRQKAGAFILELAKSEMEYTDQTPEEYTACCLAAACEEKYKGPIFLQGDHFKLEGGEDVDEVKSLIIQSIEAGFYNIDIDVSEFPLKDNAKLTANFIAFIRSQQPEGVEISIGAEVGEIGGKNTSSTDLKKFLERVKGISKVAVQTGTTHGRGGEIDFGLVQELGKIAREHALAGIVQHGASTLPNGIFKKFPESDVCEIHLSTGINQIVIDNLPNTLKSRIKSKMDFGPLKKEIWNVKKEYEGKILRELEKEFSFFFKKLKVTNTAELVSGIYN